MRVLLLSIFTLLQGTAAFDSMSYVQTYNSQTTDADASDCACSVVYAIGHTFEYYVHSLLNFGGGNVTVDGTPYAELEGTPTEDGVYDYYRKVSGALAESQNCGIRLNEVTDKVSYEPGKCVAKAISRLTIELFDALETSFRVKRDPFLRSVSELTLATGPYFASYGAHKANNNVDSQVTTATTLTQTQASYLTAMGNFMTARAELLLVIDELTIRYNNIASDLTNMPTFDVPLFREFGDCGDSSGGSESGEESNRDSLDYRG